MRQTLLVALASLFLLGSAQAAKEGAKPRLGTFKGQLAAKILTPRGPAESGPHAETVNFQVKGRRLYVTMQGGAWRQSFRVTSDVVDATGVRVISYDRDSGHGVGARNEARLDAKEGPGAPVGYRNLQGSGQVAVNRTGAGWRNVGLAQIKGIVPETKGFDQLTGWDETFQGRR